jgi:hypothetical protein
MSSRLRRTLLHCGGLRLLRIVQRAYAASGDANGWRPLLVDIFDVFHVCPPTSVDQRFDGTTGARAKSENSMGLRSRRVLVLFVALCAAEAVGTVDYRAGNYEIVADLASVGGSVPWRTPSHNRASGEEDESQR